MVYTNIMRERWVKGGGRLFSKKFLDMEKGGGVTDFK